MQASSDGTNFTTLLQMEYRFLSTETIGDFSDIIYQPVPTSGVALSYSSYSSGQPRRP